MAVLTRPGRTGTPTRLTLALAALGGVLPAYVWSASFVDREIGLALAFLGPAALGLVRDPFAGRPRLRLAVLGALVGVFLLVYRDVRLPARFGYGWFPTAPWNA
ncbi:hypothetical protein [Symbioplanes lichenis]|uniref:hypothetical protein n=1 Tax=Symbioplanes lichenis TaxID=1629072 RepID=UPI00273A475B|nr:hypothetical protein [Actinoplanes lichenis]